MSSEQRYSPPEMGQNSSKLSRLKNCIYRKMMNVAKDALKDLLKPSSFD